jgi:hypothetical protein
MTNKKNFIVVNHGVPIDPDYNILTEPKNVIDLGKPGPRSGINPVNLKNDFFSKKIQSKEKFVDEVLLKSYHI